MAKAPEDETAPEAGTTAVPAGDDFELVYVCNPKLHGSDPAKRPAPGRVTRAWLARHADKGWAECDAAGVTVKGA